MCPVLTQPTEPWGKSLGQSFGLAQMQSVSVRGQLPVRDCKANDLVRGLCTPQANLIHWFNLLLQDL